MASIAQFLHDDALRRPITPLVDAREIHDTGGTMSKESMKMNRRDFLGLGAVAAVGAMGLAGCAPQT